MISSKFLKIIQFSVGVLIVGTLIYRIGFLKIVEIISKANILFSLAAFTIVLIIVCIMSFRWKNFLESSSKKNVPILLSLKMVFVGLFFGDFTPARVGDTIRVYVAKKEKYITLSKGIPLYFIERLMDIGMLGLLIISSNIFILTFGIANNDKLNPFILSLFAIFIVFLIFLFSSILIFNKSLSKKIAEFGIENILKRISLFQSIEKNAVDIHAEFFESLDELKKDHRMLIKNMLLTVVLWNMHVLRRYMVANALGANVDIWYLFLIVPLTYIFVIIPISFGGFGIMESGAAAMYFLVGIPIDIAIAIPVLDRVLTSPFYVCMGYLIFIRNYKY